MKMLKKQIDLNKEYILTNGLGRYCSSTLYNLNTRRYHGLLVIPQNPPSDRTLVLSKLDESIQIDGKTINLFSNMANCTTSDGFKYLQCVDKNEGITFTYKVGKVEIKKTIIMQHGQNTVGVLYTITNKENKDIQLNLAPVMNFRNFHYINYDNIEIEKKVDNKDNCFVEIIFNKNMCCPIYMYVNDGKFVNETKHFEGMYYKKEDERGFDCIENHIIPGVYEIEIPKQTKSEISFVCSTNKNIKNVSVYDILHSEKVRLNNLYKNSGIKLKKLYDLEQTKCKKSLKQKVLSYDTDEFKKQVEIDQKIENVLKTYLNALDNFVVYRKSFGLHSVIAGYPWFLDWGRDSFISFEIFLQTKQYDIAKDILLTFSKKVKHGLVPNGYSEDGSKPLYNSADSSLLFIHCVNLYLKYTNDEEFVFAKMYPKMKQILKYYINGTNLDGNNIYLDKDFLLSTGTMQTQNTWMDAKVNGKPVTPRSGKTVELNALFYNGLKIMEKLSKVVGDEKHLEYAEISKNVQNAFLENLYNPQTKCLKDLTNDCKIRPNQLFSLALEYPIIDPKSEIAKNIMKVVEEKLMTPYGIQTLSKDEKGYCGKYCGNEVERDASYHNGITWPFLNGLYFDSLKNILHSFESQRKVVKGKIQKLEKEVKDEKRVKEIEKQTQVLKNIEKQIDVNSQKLLNFRKKVYNNFNEEFEKGCICQISELYNSEQPYISEGAFAQLWSVAENFKVILG